MTRTTPLHPPSGRNLTGGTYLLGLIAVILLSSAACFADSGIAQLLTPQNGRQVPGYPAIQFSWTSVPGALTYVLWVGSLPGQYDVLFVNTQSTSTSALIPPAQTYYVRMWTQKSSGWYYQDSTFSTIPAAYLTSPANGATNVDPRVQTFTWTSIVNATWYELRIGTIPGGSDIYNSWDVTVTSLTVSLNLNSNQTYYATLYTQVGGVWNHTNSSFTTGPGIARLITPANGSQVAGYPAVQFRWNNVTGATTYVLWVGSTPGTYDVLYRNTSSTSTSAPIPPGKTYYARMWTQEGSTWYYSDTTFSTTPVAYLVSPANGAAGIDPTQPIAFSWTSVPQVIWYELRIGTTPGGSDIYNTWDVTVTSVTLKSKLEF